MCTADVKAKLFQTFCTPLYTAPEMPLMFGEKIGKQKIYISAINGPSLPPIPLNTGVGPSVVQSCHSLSLLFGGKRKIEKYLFPSSRAKSRCQEFVCQ